MATSPSLSHSSQLKVEKLWWIDHYQKVSGVVRVVQETQSIAGVCSLCADDS